MDDDRSSQRWLGKLIGVIVGAFLLRGQPVLGALIGLLVGHAVDAGWFNARRDDPYRILGLTDEASDAEIDLARRRLLARHHPDRASGASRRQAERAASEINAAYDRIRKLRGRD